MIGLSTDEGGNTSRVGVYIIACYVKLKSSHDHTVLDILLALIAIRILFQSRTRADNAETTLFNFLKWFVFLREPVA